MLWVVIWTGCSNNWVLSLRQIAMTVSYTSQPSDLKYFFWQQRKSQEMLTTAASCSCIRLHCFGTMSNSFLVVLLHLEWLASSCPQKNIWFRQAPLRTPLRSTTDHPPKLPLDFLQMSSPCLWLTSTWWMADWTFHGMAKVEWLEALHNNKLKWIRFKFFMSMNRLDFLSQIYCNYSF